MIQAIKVIGDYSSSRGQGSLLDLLVDDPNDKGVYNTVLVILFRECNNTVTYSCIELEEYSRGKLRQYAYKQGPPRGCDYTPTSRVTEIPKSFQRVKASVQKCSATLSSTCDDDLIILSIHNLLNDEQIESQILNDLQQITYSEGVIITIAVDNDVQRRYVGDFKQFTAGLIEQFEKSLYQRESFNPKSEKTSIGYDNKCYICSQVREKTYGFASTFAFYTYDKPGFTSGGFKRSQGWKNYPVCPECAYALEIGKKYLEEHLSARFCGVSYYLIPKNIFAESDENLEEVFAILDDIENSRKLSLQKESISTLSGAQDDLFSLMADYENFMNFNIMFYDSPGGSSEFRILLYIEDVLPSYVQRIYAAKEFVDNLPILRNLPGKDRTTFNLSFNFGLFATFFPTDHFIKTFLELLNNVFTQTKISYPMLLSKFMEVIGEKFRKDESYWLDVRRACAILYFLNYLNLLNYRKEGQLLMNLEAQEYEAQFEEFFACYLDFFHSDVKRAVFLEGVLAQKLLNLQKFKRDGATPFRERLNGLKLNEKILKRLLPEMQNKFEEYKANYYHKLEKLISMYLLSGDFTELSNDELSFYFTMGMNLADEFKFAEKEVNQDGTDQE